MISYDKAQQIVLEQVQTLEPIMTSVLDSLGMTLAEDIMSREDIPSADIARICGFAIRSADAIHSDQRSPASLILDGNIKAGERWEKIVGPGHAVMIESGAPLPDGADTIVSNEFAVRENSKKVNIYKRERPGEHIDIRGGIIEEGELVFRKNRVLCPADIGVLGSLGIAEVPCYRKPKVSFFATGNDLVCPDQPACAGKIRSANIYAIEAHLREYSAEPVNRGIIGLDDEKITGVMIKSSESDMIIVSTGASPAVFDKVKITLQKVGMDLKFWRVAIRPGKPLVFGVFKNVPVFAISEDHQSTTIVMEEFVRPAIMKMRGKREIRRTEVVARLDREIKGGGGKTHFVGAEVKLTDDGFLAIPENHKSSTRINSLISANGIIVIPPEMNHIEAGEFVKIQIIGDPTEMN